MQELTAAEAAVKNFVSEFAKRLLSEGDTDEAIGAVMGYSPLPQRVDFIKAVLNKLSALL